MNDKIIIKNAKENNLKSISVEIPRDKLVVFTGISGSGKSSLAFDTLFAEGQRRYVESLSAYARQFLGQLDKPDVESIEGLSPSISIDQKTTNTNPRSTVGTVTEIYDYLRLLFARVGKPHCPICGREIAKQTVDQIVDQVMEHPLNTRITIKAPLIRGRKGEYVKLFEKLQKSGYTRTEVDGITYYLDEEIPINKNEKHNINVIIDRLVVSEDCTARLSEAIDNSMKLADDLVIVNADGIDSLFSGKYACPNCDVNIEEMEPRSFSFNSPFGACPDCTGLGFKMEFDEDLIIGDKTKSINQGAIKLMGFNIEASAHTDSIIRMLNKKYSLPLDVPIEDLDQKYINLLLYGNGGEQMSATYKSPRFEMKYKRAWEGIIPMLKRRYKETNSDYMKREYENYMKLVPCETCGGKKLKKESLSVTVGGLNIYELCNLNIIEAHDFFENLVLSPSEEMIAAVILKEIKPRLTFLLNVGLGYLTLWRESATLSGGESQRIRLATQIGSGLTGVMYILDEPSIGLHQRDNAKLIQTLKGLRDYGNTVIVVEHDEETIMNADFILDIGPGAGVHGGNVVAKGSPQDIMNCDESMTGRYLSGKLRIAIPDVRRTPPLDGFLRVKGAKKNNLKNIDVDIPLSVFTAVTGVSGSGKSSLLNEIVKPFLENKLNRARFKEVMCDQIEGYDKLDKIISIDQSPIGRTPRSNPATYTGVFTQIRELFAMTSDAKERGYTAGRFSFNVKGGRCENCSGDGIKKIEMNFLPDVFVPCEVCHGKRYNRETLEVKYKGKSISDVLDMTVEEAVSFFENVPSIRNKMQTIYDVGLGYIRLGQSATTLSGGEAQRIKLASELSRRSTGKTFYLLDEPTTGLHSADIAVLLKILQRLVSSGNTVVVIEHNLDVIKVADYIIDLGVEGGDEGGTIVATGTPEAIAECGASYTGQYLKRIFEKESTIKTGKTEPKLNYQPKENKI
ncbi:MAG: excinuclease ABC subunit UvrA [Clostridia bacterium]|nr:excinuclease ABC subunit UvrA [Clostridia bacterium]